MRFIQNAKFDYWGAVTLPTMFWSSLLALQNLFRQKSRIARQVARDWGQHFVFVFCLFVLFVVVVFHVSISMITRQRSILLTNTANCSDTSFSQVTEILQYLVLGKFRLQCCKKWYLQLVSESLGSLQVLLQCIGNLPCNLWREVALEIILRSARAPLSKLYLLFELILC